MANINPGNPQFPTLEHTGNVTGRLLIYHIQCGDTNPNEFYLYKSAIKLGQVIPEGVVIGCNQYDWLHNNMMKQCFCPLAPMPEDDPRILMTYV